MVTDSLPSYRDALQKESTQVKQSAELQFVIISVPENETLYLKLEADSKVVDEAVEHIGLHPSGNISIVKRLGKRLNPESNQPKKCRPLLITSNSHSMNNSFARRHHLQDIRLPIYVKKLLPFDDRKLEKEMLSTRYNLIQNKGYDSSLVRIRKFKLFYNNQPLTATWLTETWITETWITETSRIFITETWFYYNVKNSELAFGAGYDLVSRTDQRAGQHGGLL